MTRPASRGILQDFGLMRFEYRFAYPVGQFGIVYEGVAVSLKILHEAVAAALADVRQWIAQNGRAVAVAT